LKLSKKLLEAKLEYNEVGKNKHYIHHNSFAAKNVDI